MDGKTYNKGPEGVIRQLRAQMLEPSFAKGGGIDDLDLFLRLQRTQCVLRHEIVRLDILQWRTEHFVFHSTCNGRLLRYRLAHNRGPASSIVRCRRVLSLLRLLWLSQEMCGYALRESIGLCFVLRGVSGQITF